MDRHEAKDAKHFKGIKVKLFLGLTVILGLWFLGPKLAYSYILDDKIVKGVKVEGTDLGGLTKKQALVRLQSLEQQSSGFKVVFSGDENKSWTYTFSDVGLKADIFRALDEALSVGHQGSFWQRNRSISKAQKEGTEIVTSYLMDEQKAGAVINELNRMTSVNPQNPRFAVNLDGTLKVLPGYPGRNLDQKPIRQHLQEIKGAPKVVNIALKFHTLSPAYTEEEVMAKAPKGIISLMTTTFDASNKSRSRNIYLGSKAINNTFLAPGEVFSFNKVVGPRDSRNGYQEAKVILKGKLVPGLGGGICQVSSTLYNAILRADLDIVERSAHSLKVGYLPLGTDATVAYDILDFKFRNNSKVFLRVTSWVNGNKVAVAIWGDPATMTDKSIQVESVTTSVFPNKEVWLADSKLAPGTIAVDEKGTPGYRVKVYKHTYLKGKLVSTKLISTNKYPPQNKIIRYGRKPGV